MRVPMKTESGRTLVKLTNNMGTSSIAEQLLVAQG